MLGLIFSVITAASAAPVTISNCELNRSILISRSIMECDVTNTGTVAIGKISFRVTVRDTNRAIPWNTSDSEEWTSFKGGIEPGETLRHTIIFPEFPERANPETMVVDITGLVAFGPDDQPITPVAP